MNLIEINFFTNTNNIIVLPIEMKLITNIKIRLPIYIYKA